MDDMNATPLGKLPPPIIQSKQGMPPVDMPNYRDLLSQMESSKGAPTDFLSAPMDMQSGPQQPMPMMQPQQQAMMMQQQPMVMQTQQQPMQPMQPMQPVQPMQWDAGSYPGPPPAAEGHGGLVMRFVRANRSTLLVVAVVLLTLLFVAPRLARVQRFATLDGQLSLVGKVAAAAVAGGAHRLGMFVT